MPLHRRTLVSVALLGFMLIVGWFLRAPQFSYGLPASIWPDSGKTVGVAKNLARQWKQGHITIDPLFYQYPTGYANVLAGVLTLSDRKTNPYKTGRALTALAALLMGVGAFVIAYRLYGPGAGLISSSLILFGGIFIHQGIEPRIDSLQTAFLSVAFYFFIRNKTFSNRDALWAGLASGLALGTKYSAFIYLLPLLAARLLPDVMEKKNRDALIKLASWLGNTVSGFFLMTPAFLFKGSKFVERFQSELAIQRTGGLADYQFGFWDYLFYSGTTPAIQNQPGSIAAGLGWPFGIFSLFAVGWILFRGVKEKDTRWIGLSGTALLSYIFFSAYSNYFAIRFLFPLLFLLVLLCTLTLLDVSDRSTQPLFFKTLLFFFLFTPNGMYALDYWKKIQQPESRLAATHWIIQTVPAGDTVLNFMFGPALPQRYNVPRWHFPEFNSYRQATHLAPSLEKLKKRKYQWVIWNDFYTHRFMTAKGETDSPYAQQWRTFYQELKTVSDPRMSFIGESAFSPRIEVFRIQ